MTDQRYPRLLPEQLQSLLEKHLAKVGVPVPTLDECKMFANMMGQGPRNPTLQQPQDLKKVERGYTALRNSLPQVVDHYRRLTVYFDQLPDGESDDYEGDRDSNVFVPLKRLADALGDCERLIRDAAAPLPYDWRPSAVKGWEVWQLVLERDGKLPPYRLTDKAPVVLFIYEALKASGWRMGTPGQVRKFLAELNAP